MMFSFQQFWFFWSGHTFWVYKIQSLWSHTSQKSGRLWVSSPCLLLLPKSLRYKPELLVFSQSLITLVFSTPHYYEQLNHSSHVIFLTSGRYYTSLFPLQPNSVLNLGKKKDPPPPHTQGWGLWEEGVWTCRSMSAKGVTLPDWVQATVTGVIICPPRISVHHWETWDLLCISSSMMLKLKGS